jgi:hypothetical protein
MLKVKARRMDLWLLDGENKSYDVKDRFIWQPPQSNGVIAGGP